MRLRTLSLLSFAAAMANSAPILEQNLLMGRKLGVVDITMITFGGVLVTCVVLCCWCGHRKISLECEDCQVVFDRGSTGVSAENDLDAMSHGRLETWQRGVVCHVVHRLQDICL